MEPSREEILGPQFHHEVGGVFHSEVSGCNTLQPFSIGSVVLEACWAGVRDSFLIVEDSEEDCELEDVWIESPKAESTGVEHRGS